MSSMHAKTESPCSIDLVEPLKVKVEAPTKVANAAPNAAAA